MSTDRTKRAAVARVDALADAVYHQLGTGSPTAAIDRALGELTDAAQECWTRQRTMAPSVPDILWACGETAIEVGWPDSAITLRLRATQFAIIYDTVHTSGEPKFASGILFQHALALLIDRTKHLEPLVKTPPQLRPSLRAPDKFFRAVAEVLSIMQHLEPDIRLLALGLGGFAGELEPFIAVDAFQARLAAMESRFWVTTTLGRMAEYDPGRHDENLRTGIAEIIGVEREFGAVPADWLRPALNALKVALFAAGHLSPLVTLEMAFAGLDPLQQFTVDHDSPVARAALRARIELSGSVRGYGQRLENVLHSLDENTPVRYTDLIAEAEQKRDGPR